MAQALGFDSTVLREARSVAKEVVAREKNRASHMEAVAEVRWGAVRLRVPRGAGYDKGFFFEGRGIQKSSTVPSAFFNRFKPSGAEYHYRFE